LIRQRSNVEVISQLKKRRRDTEPELCASIAEVRIEHPQVLEDLVFGSEERLLSRGERGPRNTSRERHPVTQYTCIRRDRDLAGTSSPGPTQSLSFESRLHWVSQFSRAQTQLITVVCRSQSRTTVLLVTSRRVRQLAGQRQRNEVLAFELASGKFHQTDVREVEFYPAYPNLA